MVGVSGRSRACDNCRKRRLKCDLSVPRCERCAKSRLRCSGPRDIAIFSFEGQTRAFRSVQGLHDRTRITQSRTAAPLASSNSGSVIAPTLKLDQHDIFASFTISKLLPTQEGLSIAPGVITNEAFAALAATYFGIKQQETSIAELGFKKYSNALKIVHTALVDEQQSRSDDLLEAIVIMALIEFLVSEREDGWINHASGLEKLLEVRGALAMSSLDNLKILERTRPSIIFAAIVLRKPTIMARQDWKHEPWVLHPERIDSLKLLFDIIADFPQVYVTREHFLSSLKSGDTYDTMSGLLRRCHQILSNLEQWERQWAYSPSHAPREVDARPTTPFVTDVDGIVRPAWSTILHYQSLYHATAMTVFKGALILALQLTDWLQAYLEEPAEHRSARKERITAAGLFICRSVDFHQEDRWGEQGNFNILFPLRLAFQAVGENNPGIGVWISGVLRDISTGKRGTWRSARSVLNIGYTDSSALDVTP